MTTLPFFRSPLVLGFDYLEELIEQMSKTQSDGYPPYNVARLSDHEFRITLAVAGFTKNTLDITLQGSQLHIFGSQGNNQDDVYIHRGIATRKFHRTFVLASGIDVGEVILENGLLHIKVFRPDPQERIRKINIHEVDR